MQVDDRAGRLRRLPLRPEAILQGDLARHLRQGGWLTFTEIQIPGTSGDSAWGEGRVDVVAVKTSYAHRDLRAYECKASRADFLRDVGSEKWRRYLQVFTRVFFAVPAGLVQKDELPVEAGLIVRGEKGWTHVKAARSHIPPQLSVDSILALLFRGYEQDRLIRDVRDRLVYRDGSIEEAKAFGHGVAQRLRQKEHELAPVLQELKAALEGYLGKTLDDVWDIRRVSHQIESIVATLTAFETDAELIRRIAGYLGSLSGKWGRHDEATREQLALDLEHA